MAEMLIFLRYTSTVVLTWMQFARIDKVGIQRPRRNPLNVIGVCIALSQKHNKKKFHESQKLWHTLTGTDTNHCNYRSAVQQAYVTLRYVTN